MNQPVTFNTFDEFPEDVCPLEKDKSKPVAMYNVLKEERLRITSIIYKAMQDYRDGRKYSRTVDICLYGQSGTDFEKAIRKQISSELVKRFRSLRSKDTALISSPYAGVGLEGTTDRYVLLDLFDDPYGYREN